jgi:Fe-S cluster biosynthesis and repair protein YggX
MLKKDLPGLARPPYGNDLGQRIFEEVSKDAWDQWLRDAVPYINTCQVDLASPEGAKLMFKQCADYFGFEDGDLAQTARVAPKSNMSERLVHCRMLKKDLPGLARPPYRNDLGQRIFAEVSKDAWDQWLHDAVRYINTYQVDLASPEGAKFMFKQCAVYFGFEDGDLAQTAWVAPESK